MDLVTLSANFWVLLPVTQPSQAYNDGGVKGVGTSLVSGNYNVAQASASLGPGSTWEADPRFAWNL